MKRFPVDAWINCGKCEQPIIIPKDTPEFNPIAPSAIIVDCPCGWRTGVIEEVKLIPEPPE